MPLPASLAVADTVAGSAVASVDRVRRTLTESDGTVLSTVTVIAADVKALPALSVVTTRRS